MEYIGSNDVIGRNISLKATNPKHFGYSPKKAEPTTLSGSFTEALNKSLGKVEKMDVKADKLIQQFASNPDSVNEHDVMIAGAEAEMAINFTRAIKDKLIRAFQELSRLQ